MKLLGFVASTIFLVGLSGTASAEEYKVVEDPSGVEMCFTKSGEKAPLVKCQAPEHYTSTMDPSGAEMCFDSRGEKAPLAKCAKQVALKYDIATIARLAMIR